MLTSWLKKTSLGTKLSVLSAAFVVPIAILLWLFTTAKNESVAFTNAELTGNQEIQKWSLLSNRLVQMTWLSVQAKSGIAVDESALVKSSQVIPLAEGVAGDVEAAEVLRFSQADLEKANLKNLSFSAVSLDIKRLKEGMDHPAQMNLSNLTKTFQNVSDILDRIYETSNILLDPEVDTYYLGAAISFDKATLVRHLQNIGLLSAPFAKRSGIQESDIVQFGTELSKLKDNWDAMSGDFGKAVLHDSEVHGLSQKLQKEASDSFNKLKPVFESFYQAGQNLLTYKNHDSFVKFTSEGISFNKALNDFNVLMTNAMDDMLTQRNLDTQSEIWRGFAWTGFAIVFAVGLATMIGWQVTRDLKHLSERLRLAFDKSQLKDTASQLSHEATEMISQATGEASAVQETTATATELAATVKRNSELADEFAHSVHQAQGQTDMGGRLVENQDHVVQTIFTNSSNLQNIDKIIDEITQKVAIINEIVIETRLLSFNASIEAARAGGHGKGFAVVADEVGKLAVMSGKSAHEIHSLIERSRSEIKNSVQGTVEPVKKCWDLVSNFKDVFHQIHSSMERIAEASQQLAQASREQAAGMNDANKALYEIDKATHHSERTAQELETLSKRVLTGTKEIESAIQNLYDTLHGAA